MIIERIRIAVPAAYRAPFHRPLVDTGGNATSAETEEAIVEVSPDGRQRREQPHNPKEPKENDKQDHEETSDETPKQEHHVNIVV
jgi:hypothetical protein